MSKKMGPAALKAIESAVAELLAEAPVRPAGKKLELHPCGSFDFEVTHVYVKVAKTITAAEVLPGLTVETGTPRIRVEFKSSEGVVREDYTVWTSPENKKVWIGLSTVLTSLGSTEITDIQGFAAVMEGIPFYVNGHANRVIAMLVRYLPYRLLVVGARLTAGSYRKT